MRRLKEFYLTAMFAVTIAIAMTITGCGQAAEESDKDRMPEARQQTQDPPAAEQTEAASEKNTAKQAEVKECAASQTETEKKENANPEESSFVFRMNTGANGHLQSGKLKSGDRAVLVKDDGTCYDTTVEKISWNKEMDPLLDEAEENSFLFVELMGIETEQAGIGDLLLGITEWEQGVPIDFPFEESEEYSLVSALPERGERQGEFRLYDKKGEVLQRIPQGIFTEQDYCVIYRNDRRNLVFFPDENSEAGRLLEWNDGQFTEVEMDINRGLLLYGDLLFTEESEKTFTMEIYRAHPEDIVSEEIRRFTLQKDTGELIIWDCLDKKNVFQKMIAMESDGTPVNEAYYQTVFTEGLYPWLRDEEDIVPVNLCLRSTDQYSAEYESKEAFLSDYGFAGSEPMYEFHDRMDNLRLELYGNERKDLFCGILYRYFYDSEKQKCFRMTGFAVDDIAEAEWVDDTYTALTSYDDYDYEKSIEYTADHKPAHFLMRGDDGTVEKEEENVMLLKIDYIYRDDGTLYDRHYRHNAFWRGSTRSSEDSLYDEKERLVYEQAYITHGTLEDYYIYLDDGSKPAYHLNFDYCGGKAPATSMEQYR